MSNRLEVIIFIVPLLRESSRKCFDTFPMLRSDPNGTKLSAAAQLAAAARKEAFSRSGCSRVPRYAPASSSRAANSRTLGRNPGRRADFRVDSTARTPTKSQVQAATKALWSKPPGIGHRLLLKIGRKALPVRVASSGLAECHSLLPPSSGSSSKSSSSSAFFGATGFPRTYASRNRCSLCSRNRRVMTPSPNPSIADDTAASTHSSTCARARSRERNDTTAE